MSEMKWQPIETAPRDGTVIDLWCGGRICDARWMTWPTATDDPETYCWWAPEPTAYGYAVVWEMTQLGLEPTHWMPLPPTPEDV